MPAATKYRLRRDTAANWNSVNPVLAAGEQGFETDTLKVKVGNGTSAWTALGYVGAGAATAPFFDIRNYGATTAAANNQTAIQAAIDAAASTGGGRVFVPQGIWITGPLVLKHRVWLDGAGMRASELKQVAGANSDSFICNYASSNGTTDPNAQFVSVTNMTLNGNQAQQTAGLGRGVYFAQNPLFGQPSGDEFTDPRQRLENVLIWNFRGNGFEEANGRSETRLFQVHAFFCNGHGFVPGPDTMMISCVAGSPGLSGFYLTQPSQRVTACKAFYAGRITPTVGHGFHLVGTRGVTMVGCEAQDCQAAGLRTEGYTERINVQGFIADSNSKRGKNLHAGVELNTLRYSLIDAVCFERNDPAVADTTSALFSAQRHALELETDTFGNRIDITHSAHGSAVVEAPIMPSANTAALVSRNLIRINSQDAYRVGTFAATYTPAPYNGSKIALTLTGNITINATTQMHAGIQMTFIFNQDATGGRTVTWNAQYKVSWQPDTAPNAVNTISLIYDGANWVQSGQGTQSPAAASGSVSYYNHITLSTSFGAVAWTNMPAAATEFNNAARSRQKVILTNAVDARLTLSVHVGGAAASIIYIEYSIDQTTWTAMGLSQAMDSAGAFATAFVAVPAAAQGDVWLRVMGSGGDGVIDPMFGTIGVGVRYTAPVV